MNKRIIAGIFLSCIFLSALCVYWLRFGFANIWLREGIYLSTSFFATVAGLFALRSFGLTSPRSRTLLFLTAGIGYWFLGEIIFDYYQYILGIDPFPSVADAFYLFAYPLLLLGLINEVISSQVQWRKIHRGLLFLFISISLALGVIVFYFGVFRAYNPEVSLLANAIVMSYGVGDLFLLTANLFVLLLAWEFRGGKLSRVWLFFFLSFVLNLVADVLYAVYEVEYESLLWFYKSLIDTFFIGSYLLFAYAMFDFGISILEAFTKVMSLERKDE
jgi:hypothetical protein